MNQTKCIQSVMNENTSKQTIFLERLKHHLEVNQFNVKNEDNNLFIERKFYSKFGTATKYIILAQVRGVIKLDGSKVTCQLNFNRQLKLIISSLLLPFILFSLLYSDYIVLIFLIFIIIGSLWSVFAISKIKKIVEDRISKRKFIIDYKINYFNEG